jgi:hypothetical protein
MIDHEYEKLQARNPDPASISSFNDAALQHTVKEKTSPFQDQTVSLNAHLRFFWFYFYLFIAAITDVQPIW